MSIQIKTLFIVLVILAGCQHRQESNRKLFIRISSEVSGVDFVNTIETTEDLNIFKYRNFFNGGGVAIGDINNDGLDDIYLTANMRSNKLYLNKGNFVFEDITIPAGVGGRNTWSTGVVFVDVNSDHLLDIYVSNSGIVEGDDKKNELFINNGDLTFIECAADYGLDEEGFTTHSAFLDYDLDGDLDVYILNNSFIPVSSLGYNNKRALRSADWNVPDFLKGGGDKLLRNDEGKFVDVSEEAGIFGSLIGFGLGVAVGDLNNDNYPDLYISNDFYERDYCYLNQGDGTFSEVITQQFKHLSLSSMGNDIADINNDGFLDIYVTDMLSEDDKRLKQNSDFETYDLLQFKRKQGFYHQYMQNTLQINNGNNTFSEVAHMSGVSKTDWSWSTLMVDMDNDGNKDIFVSNGIFNDLTDMDFMNFFANDVLQKMVLTGKKEEVDEILDKMPSTPIPNYAFRNRGNLTFENATTHWGFDTPGFSNGTAYGDLDNDGDLDLVINNVNQKALIYKNTTQEKLDNHFLRFTIKGDSGNTFGLGSSITLFSGEQQIFQEVYPSRGFQSSVTYNHIIGLGSIDRIDSIIFNWPSGEKEVRYQVPSNQSIVFSQDEAISDDLYPPKRENTIFSRVEKKVLVPHMENNFNDFDFEGTIQKMLSKEGPSIESLDVNQDGNDDLFVSGGKGQKGRWYLTSSAEWNAIDLPAPLKASREQVASTLVDVDNDGDKDLFIGFGGNEQSSASYEPILYLNEGNGNFQQSEHSLPENRHSTSVLVPHDFDRDGDEDVFLGSRNIPGVYGLSPANQLLVNNGDGTLSNRIDEVAPALKKIGMVSSAVWANMVGDDQLELVVTGDWMFPMIFEYTDSQLVPVKTNLTKYTGFWSRVVASDLDNDGNMDLVLGNRGSNVSYPASATNPLRLFIGDFDLNGTNDPIFTHTVNAEDKPIHMKSELTKQLPILKKKNILFSEYADKSLDELLETLENTDSFVLEAGTNESMIAYGDGKGEFEIAPLPKEAQMSSVRSIVFFDYNNDGFKDLIIGGNDYDFKPQFSRLDASFGLMLENTKDRSFKAIPPHQSGLSVNGQVRNICWLNVDNEEYLTFAINGQSPEIYKLNE